ncbi:MAG: LuxR family transcriptional regulator, partial [Mycobacterium sp.]
MSTADPADLRRWSALLAAVRNVPATPLKTLITGGIGTGKSSLLAEIRNILRNTGIDVRSRPPTDGDTAVAVVVDDAHLLPAEDLRALTALVSEPTATVLVAAEARDAVPALRELMTAIERENPRLALRPLPRTEVAAHTDPQDTARVNQIVSATAGLPFLVAAARTAAAADVATVVQNALTERLRRTDGPLLDTLLVTSLSPDLGPTDVAAALSIDLDAAQSLVTSAHATGLLDPAHGAEFLTTVHDAAARIVGTARHRDLENALLRTQLEMDTLAAELALRLAEHGVRDHGLVTALRGEAARTRSG